MQKLWGFTAWLNSVSVTGMVALSSPEGGSCSSGLSLPREAPAGPQSVQAWHPALWGSRGWQLCLCLPSCLMPSLSSMRSCTRGMSMCRRGPCGGPFTGVSKLRLFLL